MAREALKMRSAAVVELDPDDAFQGMTSAQQMFVSLSFSGLNDTEAYRQTFNVAEPLPANVHVMAHNPLVVRKLKELVASRDRQSTLASWLTKDWILHGIAGLAQTADKDSTRLAAYVALGKTAGIDLFRETVRHEQVTRTVEDAARVFQAIVGEG